MAMKIEDKIVITATCYNEIINHGIMNYPYEVCGLLSGTNNKVLSVWKLENELKSDRRFYVGEKAVAKNLKSIANKNEMLLAIYHSHPTTAPLPSHYDISNHMDDNIIMVIITYKTKTPKMKCYRISNGTYRECVLIIEQTS